MISSLLVYGSGGTFSLLDGSCRCWLAGDWASLAGRRRPRLLLRRELRRGTGGVAVADRGPGLWVGVDFEGRIPFSASGCCSIGVALGLLELALRRRLKGHMGIAEGARLRQPALHPCSELLSRGDTGLRYRVVMVRIEADSQTQGRKSATLCTCGARMRRRRSQGSAEGKEGVWAEMSSRCG